MKLFNGLLFNGLVLNQMGVQLIDCPEYDCSKYTSSVHYCSVVLLGNSMIGEKVVVQLYFCSIFLFKCCCSKADVQATDHGKRHPACDASKRTWMVVGK